MIDILLHLITPKQIQNMKNPVSCILNFSEFIPRNKTETSIRSIHPSHPTPYEFELLGFPIVCQDPCPGPSE